MSTTRMVEENKYDPPEVKPSLEMDELLLDRLELDATFQDLILFFEHKWPLMDVSVIRLKSIDATGYNFKTVEVKVTLK